MAIKFDFALFHLADLRAEGRVEEAADLEEELGVINERLVSCGLPLHGEPLQLVESDDVRSVMACSFSRDDLSKLQAVLRYVLEAGELPPLNENLGPNFGVGGKDVIEPESTGRGNDEGSNKNSSNGEGDDSTGDDAEADDGECDASSLVVGVEDNSYAPSSEANSGEGDRNNQSSTGSGSGSSSEAAPNGGAESSGSGSQQAGSSEGESEASEEHYEERGDGDLTLRDNSSDERDSDGAPHKRRRICAWHKKAVHFLDAPMSEARLVPVDFVGKPPFPDIKVASAVEVRHELAEMAPLLQVPRDQSGEPDLDVVRDIILRRDSLTHMPCPLGYHYMRFIWAQFFNAVSVACKFSTILYIQ